MISLFQKHVWSFSQDYFYHFFFPNDFMVNWEIIVAQIWITISLFCYCSHRLMRFFLKKSNFQKPFIDGFGIILPPLLYAALPQMGPSVTDKVSLQHNTNFCHGRAKICTALYSWMEPSVLIEETAFGHSELLKIHLLTAGTRLWCG